MLGCDAGLTNTQAMASLSTERLKPRQHLPPLLVALTDRKPERLHWIGVAFGVTLELFNFWQRCATRCSVTVAVYSGCL